MQELQDTSVAELPPVRLSGVGRFELSADICKLSYRLEMNYLAHLYLSDDSPRLLLGALLGDFVGAGYRGVYPEEVCRGIELHRHVDRFTDSHYLTAKSRRRLSDDYRLLKGVMIDVFYDHFLANNWQNYSDEPLEDFCSRVYRVLLTSSSPLPLRLQNMLPRMACENWLLSYREVGTIELVMRGLSRRLRRPNNLAMSYIELERHYAGLEKDFQGFFPELKEFAQDWKGAVG